MCRPGQGYILVRNSDRGRGGIIPAYPVYAQRYSCGGLNQVSPEWFLIWLFMEAFCGSVRLIFFFMIFAN